MKRTIGYVRIVLLSMGLAGVLCLSHEAPVRAVVPNPGPGSGSIGVQGTIPSVPPRVGATIVSPVNGQTFSTTPITVRGLCPSGLLVKIFDNGIFVGATVCKNGSYSIEIALFNGQNQLQAHVFDALDQEGPVSNTVTVTFADGQFAAFGNHVMLTSPYARRGANPNQQLVWPIVISGGTGPYALSIDWGDGSPASLQSVQYPGELDVVHTYKTAGTYLVIMKASDSNGTEAYLQVVAVISGNTSGRQGAAGNGNGVDSEGTGNGAGVSTTTLLISAAMILILPPISFWLGRRYELSTLRQRLERERQA